MDVDIVDDVFSDSLTEKLNNTFNWALKTIAKVVGISMLLFVFISGCSPENHDFLAQNILKSLVSPAIEIIVFFGCLRWIRDIFFSNIPERSHNAAIPIQSKRVQSFP